MTAKPRPVLPNLSDARGTMDCVRVMIVDDSLIVRTAFTRMIDQEPDMMIAASASTAESALAQLAKTDVDVILLDLEMPGMGGLEALPRILETGRGAQVLVVSSLTMDGAEHTLSALQMGAADTLLKPRPGGFTEDYRAQLLGKIRALGTRSADRSGDSALVPQRSEPPASFVRPPLGRRRVRPEVVAIGASTGGIHALGLMLRRIAVDHPLEDRADRQRIVDDHHPDRGGGSGVGKGTAGVIGRTAAGRGRGGPHANPTSCSLICNVS